MEFVQGEEDPPLAEQPVAEQNSKAGLFKRLTTGFKGVFGAGEQVERNEPSMGAFVEEAEDASKILNFEGPEEEMGQTPLIEEETLAEAQENLMEDGMEDTMEDGDDQLAIPSFLRKQA